MSFLLLLLASAAPAVERLAPNLSDQPSPLLLTEVSPLVFASAKQGRDLLGEHDIYIQSLAALERQIRLKSEQAVSKEAFVEHVQKQVMPWSEDDRKLLTTVAGSLAEKLQGLHVPLPEEVVLIQTTGKDESDAAYTRGAAIVLPRKRMELKPAALERLLAHELFHVISRHAPELRKQLYAIIGFQPCNPIELPTDLAKQQITNPDAPWVDYYITIEHEGAELQVVPILLTDRDEFDPQRQRLFDYLQFRLLAIEKADNLWRVKLTEDQPILIDGRTCEPYRERIGRNTNYIIHPDEILADNFVHMAMQTKDLKSPEIVKRMREVFEKEPGGHEATEEKEEEVVE